MLLYTAFKKSLSFSDLQYIRKHVPDAGSCQPCARRYHTTVVFDNVMYVYGGFVDLQGSTAEIWAYHIGMN